uniref:Uncharacterized protein n=1 Tax=Tanacetum cinerariifolium TaxID=118510 RepID=A0A6L2JMX1_TANCI|nr:hypothetical protein [Tanacetum cinerariifolium]
MQTQTSNTLHNAIMEARSKDRPPMLAPTEVHSPSIEIPVEESVLTPSNDLLPSAKKIPKLKKRVKKLEKRTKSRPEGLRRLKKGRNFEDIDRDVEITLVDKAQGRMHDAKMFGVDDLEGNEVFLDVREKTFEKQVSIANLVTTAGEVVTAASVEDSAAPTTTKTTDDKGKAKIIKLEKPLKKKDQIALDEEVARKLKAKMRAKIEEEEERIVREKDKENIVVIEEWDDVQATIDADRKLAKLKKGSRYPLKKDLSFLQSLLNQGEKNVEESLKKTKEECSSKRACQELEQESAKKQKLAKQEQAKRRLRILRSIVKERFKKTKPVDDMENLLFQTLKTMFEPHVEDIIWKYQQGAIKVNNWNLFDSCEVYCVTTKMMVYYLLVEKMYPFTNSILYQLWSAVRLQVDYEGRIVRFKGLHGVTTAQLVLLVYKVAVVFNKVNATKSRVTTAIRVSTARWIKWLEEQDMQVNEIY